MSKESQTLFPNKALENALHSLDVNLEQEIFRYRRKRGIQRVSDRGLLTLSASPQLDSIVTTSPESSNPQNTLPTRLQTGIAAQGGAVGQAAGGLARTETKDSPPGDYLASSEQLLRSLAEPETRSLRQSATNSWLNPLGLAALLLLLIAGGALAYVIEPSWWASLIGGKKDTPVASNTVSTIARTPSSTASPAISAPNLAANSNFLDLKLQNLSSVPTTPSVYPKPSAPVTSLPVIENPPANAAPGVQNPQNLVSALIPSSQGSANSQQPKVVRSQVSTEGLPKLGRAAPDGKIYYYVLTNYVNNNSLRQGRKIARDAFIVQSPAGRKVQIATFIRQVDADALVKKLQKQGIAAQVYQD